MKINYSSFSSEFYLYIHTFLFIFLVILKIKSHFILTGSTFEFI